MQNIHNIRSRVALLAAALSMLIAAPSLALQGAGGFTLVNKSGQDWIDVEIRRTRTSDYRPLTGSLAQGEALKVVFTDPDCAFDLRVKVVGGGTAEWAGVNLCETQIVRLNQDKAGTRWVDYD